MQLVPRNGTQESEERTAYITKFWKYQTDYEMGLALNLSAQSISNYRSWLGFRRQTYNFIENHVKARICEIFFCEHLTLKEISIKTGISVYTVSEIISKILIPKVGAERFVITKQSVINF